jgi:prolipoprotein diacylglyceryltransferase
MYLQYYRSKEDANPRTKNILFYSICILYGFTLAIFALDISSAVNESVSDNSVHDHIFFLDFILTYSCADRQS